MAVDPRVFRMLEAADLVEDAVTVKKVRKVPSDSTLRMRTDTAVDNLSELERAPALLVLRFKPPFAAEHGSLPLQIHHWAMC